MVPIVDTSFHTKTASDEVRKSECEECVDCGRWMNYASIVIAMETYENGESAVCWIVSSCRTLSKY